MKTERKIIIATFALLAVMVAGGCIPKISSTLHNLLLNQLVLQSQLNKLKKAEEKMGSDLKKPSFWKAWKKKYNTSM